MLTLDMSPTFSRAFIHRILDMDAGPAYGSYYIPQTTPSMVPLMGGRSSVPAIDNPILPSSGIALMSDTMPADINTVTSYSAILPNILVNYRTVANLYPVSIITSNQVTFNSLYVNAIASGTATWFLGYSVGFNNYTGQLSDTIFQGFMGTVGVPNSGSDLEISSVSIVAGSSYKILDLKLVFPTSW